MAAPRNLRRSGALCMAAATALWCLALPPAAADPGQGQGQGQGAGQGKVKPDNPGQGKGKPGDPGEGSGKPENPGQGGAKPDNPGQGGGRPAEPASGKPEPAPATQPIGPGDQSEDRPAPPAAGTSTPSGDGEGTRPAPAPDDPQSGGRTSEATEADGQGAGGSSDVAGQTEAMTSVHRAIQVPSAPERIALSGNARTVDASVTSFADAGRMNGDLAATVLPLAGMVAVVGIAGLAFGLRRRTARGDVDVAPGTLSIFGS